MENLVHLINWGTPLGIGLFLLLLSCSAAVFVRALSLSKKTDKKD